VAIDCAVYNMTSKLDGIGSHWPLDDHEGLDSLDPSLIPAVIYRGRKRGRDDASVVAVRERLQA
jgi:hypothetical protein